MNSSSLLILKHAGTLSALSLVDITVSASNNIVAICGSPNSTVYFGNAYQARTNLFAVLSSPKIPSISSRLILPDLSLGAFTSNSIPFSSFPAIGSDSDPCASFWNSCSGHGVCDYCTQKCICDQGWGYYPGYSLNGLVSTTCAEGLQLLRHIVFYFL